jgi:hypothetical protein
MSADPVPGDEQDRQLQEMIHLVRALDVGAPAELARLVAAHGLEDEVRRAAEAMTALSFAAEHSPDISIGEMVTQVKHSGPARKVSVSMPEDLTAAVQQRVGRGKFSQYVTEAVARQLELDLLDELSDLLSARHGPVPDEFMAEARAAWPESE